MHDFSLLSSSIENIYLVFQNNIVFSGWKQLDGLAEEVITVNSWWFGPH